MGIIELQNVTVEFGQTKALQSVNMAIEPGEMTSLIGPNGAGKTTALRVMAGLLEPTQGRLLYHGEELPIQEFIRLRRNATLVFQKPTVFSTTVFKNVAYGLRVRGIPESEVEDRVKQALTLVELESLVERSARSLSGGEQRRLCLAMGLVVKPELLLLDEPTAYLDSENTLIIENALKRLNREEGTTIIIATHNMIQAEILTQKAVIIQNGMIHQTGTTRELLRDRLESMVLEDTTSNLYHGVARFSEGPESGRRLARIWINDKVAIEAISHKEGTVTIRIPPEDIVVSHGGVLSSARNTLEGLVTNISLEEGMAYLTVDVGIDLIAQITRRSLETLNVKVGEEVNVTFKASSVRVY
ncbi:MAG: ABC transporter ATP-binding protein [Candidatus Thorarchaeota archaeon]